MNTIRINPRIYFMVRNIVAISDIADVDVRTVQNLVDLSKGNRRTIIFLDNGLAFAVGLRVETIMKYLDEPANTNKKQK